MDDKELKETLADKEWWQSMLPTGWVLYGWTRRSSANAITPDKKRVIELNAELLCAFAGRPLTRGR